MRLFKTPGLDIVENVAVAAAELAFKGVGVGGRTVAVAKRSKRNILVEGIDEIHQLAATLEQLGVAHRARAGGVYAVADRAAESGERSIFGVRRTSPI